MVKQTMRMAPRLTEEQVEPEITSLDQLTPEERARIAARQSDSVSTGTGGGAAVSEGTSPRTGASAGEDTGGETGNDAGESAGEKTGGSAGRKSGRRLGRPRGPERAKLSVRILKAHDDKLTQAVEQTGKNPQELVDQALKLLFAKLKI
ncbi:hypothetical protein ACFWXO_36760 [Kitasatospora sp. NPDC059088]|uniref:hypothetical protein n=1 Tax=Kitasatospora sp. NPDC059088 TaxID=3346722 RepID=UPI0036D00D9C